MGHSYLGPEFGFIPSDKLGSQNIRRSTSRWTKPLTRWLVLTGCHRVFIGAWLALEVMEEKPSGWGMFPGFEGVIAW